MKQRMTIKVPCLPRVHDIIGKKVSAPVLYVSGFYFLYDMANLSQTNEGQEFTINGFTYVLRAENKLGRALLSLTSAPVLNELKS